MVYVGILTAIESFEHALLQFAQLWYLMAPLIVGFGIQIGLFTFVREGFKQRALNGATGSVASSGGVSAGSMVLCCLHHVTDVLPFIGLSAAAIFLTQFQPFFLLLGILSNIVGITMMFHLMQKSGLYPKMGLFSGMFNYDMLLMRNGAILASVFLLVGFIVISAFMIPPPISAATGRSIMPDSGITDESGLTMNLQRIDKSEAGVSIEATPVNFEFGKDVVFNIGLNTHSGSLDFDVAQIAILKDGIGNVYDPLSWEGSPPGGHHRSGELTFPPITESSYMELSLSDIYGVPSRVFRWELSGG
jgi:hypothetical protein